MEMAAKTWRLAAVLVVAAVFTCLAPRAAAAEMAPSPSPDSGDDGTPDAHLDEQVYLSLLNLIQMDVELEESELVALQKYMDQLEVSVGGKGFRFNKTVWDLSPRELGFKLGVIFAQATLQCNIIARVSGDPSKPPPQTPFFIRDKLQLSGIVITAQP
jgi:hypothetical protein